MLRSPETRVPAAPQLDEALLEIVRPLESVGLSRSTRTKKVGGKAAALARLVREGFSVPRGWVLDARHFVRAVRELPAGHDLSSLIKLAGTRIGVDRAARARERLLATELPDDVKRALAALWSYVEAEAPWGLAVRSSATCEDGEETSLAGLATTVLGVRGPAALEDAVRRVWASAVMPRALDYCAHSDVRDLSMAVVFQVMVRAEAAGVLFTAPPRGLESENWRAGERMVNATLGLGAPVVDGATTSDATRLAATGEVVAEVIADKRRALVVGPSGPVEEDVEPARATAPALARATLRELARLAERLETFVGGPADVEFAVEASAEGPRVLVLQARPQSGRGYPTGGEADTVWSRANVGEALPGAATPLTWSIAEAFSEKGFREAFSSLGCRVPKGAHLVANVHGRFYLNLSEFMRIAAQVPGLSPRALLEVSGGASGAAIDVLEHQIEEGRSWRGFVLRLPITAPRLLLQHARLDRTVAAFDERAERARRSLEEMDLSLLPDDALTTTLRSARALLDETGTLMLSCASASLASHLALCELLRRIGPRRASVRGDPAEEADAAPNEFTGAEVLAQTLVGGMTELDSARPGVALARVAEAAIRDPAGREALLSGQVRTPADLGRGPLREALDDFLARYGDRAVREAELATPRWREEPASILAMLRSALSAPSGDPDRALGRARAVADRELALLETRVSTPTLALVRSLVTRTQRFTRLREHMRTWVTRVLGMLRIVALDVDRRLLRIDPSLGRGGVFFCTYEELLAALSSGRAEVGRVVRLRRAEHARDASRPDPPATFVGRPPPAVLPPASGSRLVGLAASGGVVEGPARVLDPGSANLDVVRPGEILVSRTTDVGLSPLFLVAAAVVTELGGPLSHAAVVAREYGVPAVVNVTGATAAIRTGDRLRVDGDRGVVDKL